jgi:hypothetical protein
MDRPRQQQNDKRSDDQCTVPHKPLAIVIRSPKRCQGKPPGLVATPTTL